MDGYSEADIYGIGNIKIWRQIRSDQIWSVRCSSMPRFWAEWVVLNEELQILASCLLKPVSRNSVLEEFSVRRFAYDNRYWCYKKTTTFLFHKRWWQSVKYGEVSNKVSNRRTKDEPVMTKMSKSGYLRCRQQMSTKYGQVMAKVRWNNAVTDNDSSRYYTRMILWEWWKLNRYIYLGLNRTNVFWAIMECKSKK